MPRRIQLSRKRGWRKPEGAVVVSRPSKWGNPFTIDVHGTREQVLSMFRKVAEEWDVSALKNKDLACLSSDTRN